VPPEVSRPFTSWPSDFDDLPTVSFVIPNQKHDMHDGTIEEADAWLEEHLDAYRQWAMTHNSLLIVTWDEDDHKSENQIPTLFVGSMVQPGRYPETIDHFDVLRTIEDMFGLSPIGGSADATPITDVWTVNPPAPDCNSNGAADGLDIASGASRDENQDRITDEWTTGK
jgi:hypothetical protein